jgi:hypothetical protein
MSDSHGLYLAGLERRLRELRSRAASLSPLDLHRILDSIRAEAELGGFDALEGVARLSSQLALLPGCRVRTGACLDHVAEALAARTAGEREAVLAAITARLH